MNGRIFSGMLVAATAFPFWPAPVALAAEAQTPSGTATAASASTGCHEDYSSRTVVGTLLDDPQAHAVLVQLVPDVVSSPQIDMGRNMSLRDMQPYAPDALPDALLDKIDAELAKLSCKPMDQK